MGRYFTRADAVMFATALKDLDVDIQTADVNGIADAIVAAMVAETDITVKLHSSTISSLVDGIAAAMASI
jgi:hypothetical protein